MSVGAFGIEKEGLEELLKEASIGKSQLPEFQRGWVWADRNIAGLIASISLGYPVGTIMMLRTGGNITFHTLPIEGYASINGQSVNKIDVPTVRKFVHDLFYPVKASASPSATTVKKPTKINYAHLANGNGVDGSKIPCVN